MQEENIKDQSIFMEWLAEEHAYLTGLNKEPIEETVAMDYYQSLVDLAAAEYIILDFHVKQRLNVLFFILQDSGEGYPQHLSLCHTF
jgi:hypothetical protein